MRAYFKTATHHPLCVYFTADEAARFLEEMTCVSDERFPALANAERALNRAFEKMEESA